MERVKESKREHCCWVILRCRKPPHPKELVLQLTSFVGHVAALAMGDLHIVDAIGMNHDDRCRYINCNGGMIPSVTKMENEANLPEI